MNKQITNIEEYMNRQYPHHQWIAGKILSVPDFIQSELGDVKNNCSLASMTRILEYHLKLPRKDLYAEIFTLGLKHGFMPQRGIFPNKIDNIANDFFKKHQIEGRCRGSYFGNFYKPVMREIDGDRPLMMNIGIGYYRDHSLTVVGYRIYRYQGMNIKILEVIDGWRRGISYMDYSQLTGLFSLPIFSFNTFEIKKISP